MSITNPYTDIPVIELSNTDSNLLINVRDTKINVIYAEYVNGSNCWTIKKNQIHSKKGKRKREE